ncbi:hypothetical protein QVD17_28114 [Tagetes erecta]|uniref:F-box domain-containing protein n=1 Tax=Tagetes erecta TaxID=13708 RepID=A0AAD8KG68_TARER|nr:hypothetical protein QVD17_28114 [Tagetes erecta]
MAELPSEIIHNIFSRMSVKSLARSRCVSKQWYAYINDNYLEIMHAKRAAVYDPMLIMFHQLPFVIHMNAPCTLSFLDYKYEEDDCTLEVRKKPSVMEFMTSMWCFTYPNDIILGSCNGLIYSSQGGCDDDNMLVVINPLKKKCYVLPPIKTPFHSQQSPSIDHGQVRKHIGSSNTFKTRVDKADGLGFDESTNTFKMVSVEVRKPVRSSNVDYQVKEDVCTMVHVLGTESWRKIPQVPCYPITGEGVFANGCLHWLISDEDDDDRPTYLGRPVVSFDVVNEGFGLINPPQERPSGWVREQLVDLNGKLGYVYNIVNRIVEVWVLMERGWVMHCEFRQKPPLPRGFIKVLGFWNEDGDILMTDETKNMFVYDRSNRLYEVCFDRKEKDGVDIRLYQSSLFSTRYSFD